LSLDTLPHRFAAWFAGRPTHTKVLLCLATALMVGELLFRRLAPRSRAYAAWTRFFEGIGKVWTAVLLAVIYVLSVGPISLLFRLFGKDPLDRRLGAEPSYWRGHEANPLGAEKAVRHQF
jgi:Saxitoxin biosynthesis operon protein SxtJ